MGMAIRDSAFAQATARQAVKYGQRRILSRATRSIPWIGAAVALVTIGATIRRKGVLGGTLDTVLNAIPFVGAVKNTAEVVRGRDFIRDRKLAGSCSSPATQPPSNPAT
jgi:hypothetical protein